tara:strand:+ start:2551 stop:3045 length:495 start_codon:yes stop_codon:yes gene_type:complete
MIQLTYKDYTYTFNVTTEDVRIDTSVPKTQIRHLCKFTNDMDGGVKYAYGATETIYDRYTRISMISATLLAPNVFLGKIDFIPNGYWKYEVYEVSYNGTAVVNATQAPATESTPATDQEGIFGTVKGVVEIGKLFVTETSGLEQVQYTQREEPSGQTNYIYYGQ